MATRRIIFTSMMPRAWLPQCRWARSNFHIWGSTIDRLDAADRLVFDLDPDPSVTFETVKAGGSLALRDALAGHLA